jgi:hypothetical protein
VQSAAHACGRMRARARVARAPSCSQTVSVQQQTWSRPSGFTAQRMRMAPDDACAWQYDPGPLPPVAAPDSYSHPDQAPAGVKLYEFAKAASGAAGWALLSSHAAPRFYDANGEEGGRKADWMIEVGAEWVGDRVRSAGSRQAPATLHRSLRTIEKKP